MPSGNVVSSAHADGAVLMDLTSGHMFAANRTGEQIWRGIQAQLSLEDIVSELSREHAVSVDIVHTRVVEFVTYLANHRLVEMRTA
jgi:hypothetical protein